MRVSPHLDERLELDLSLGLHVLVLTLTLCSGLLRISHLLVSRVMKKPSSRPGVDAACPLLRARSKSSGNLKGSFGYLHSAVEGGA